MPDNPQGSASAPAGSEEAKKDQAPAQEGSETGQPEASTENLMQEYQKLQEEYQKLEKQANDAQSHVGKQGQELGNLRQQQEELQSTIEELQEELSQRSSEENSSQVQEQVQRLFNEGEYDKAMQVAMDAKEQEWQQQTQQIVQDALQQRDAEQMFQQYIQNNPDYVEMYQNGTLDTFVQQNPIYQGNPIAAHQALRHQQAQQAMEEKVAAAKSEGMEAGKAEIESLAQGSQAQQTTVTEPGSSMQTAATPKRALTDSELREQMTQAIEESRKSPA